MKATIILGSELDIKYGPLRLSCKVEVNELPHVTLKIFWQVKRTYGVLLILREDVPSRIHP